MGRRNPEGKRGGTMQLDAGREEDSTAGDGHDRWIELSLRRMIYVLMSREETRRTRLMLVTSYSSQEPYSQQASGRARGESSVWQRSAVTAGVGVVMTVQELWRKGAPKAEQKRKDTPARQTS
jgi:hypothetical protein